MGIFQVELEIGDPRGARFESVSAMVDTGASYTLIPAPLLRDLGVVPHTERTLMLADGRRVQMGYAWTWMKIDGQQDISPVIFGNDDATPLLGMMTLELFALGIDPVSQRLIQVDALA